MYFRFGVSFRLDCNSCNNTVCVSPGVGAEADERGVVVLYVGPQTFMISQQEVFSAPDADGAIVSAGGQVFPVTAEVQARHCSIVTLTIQTHTHRQ